MIGLNDMISNYYEAASFITGFSALPCPQDVRNVPTPAMCLGFPLPLNQYYPEYPPTYNQLTYLPEYPQPSYYSAAPVPAPAYYSTNDVANQPNTSTHLETSANDSWLENSTSSVQLEDDVVSVDGESCTDNPQHFVGTFAPSYRGATPVLLYRIPSTDLCYVYNRIRTVDGSKGHYVCRECYLKKKYVPAKVIDDTHFVKDPMAGGHICKPKSFSKEFVSRSCARKRCHCGDDSGISTSFT
ncbi:unnamed protein product [Cylicocyclus nassatus]|uniref:Uncharacterized protein n=1 Tax=Cylicocyclus nassatus TaxID=53992 RepID=A0AA36MDA0_CYLNA|nr:unnamed protein product [Cylicocyclus nassatus]